MCINLIYLRPFARMNSYRMFTTLRLVETFYGRMKILQLSQTQYMLDIPNNSTTWTPATDMLYNTTNGQAHNKL